MSPTELGLTDALIEIEKELKSPDSPLKKITDYFVEPFTNAVERIRSLLKNTSFLEPIDNLAKSMGAGLGKLEKTTYGTEGTNFFEIMAKDATSNIPVITSAIEGIMKLFADVAKAADPAFHKLSEDWNNFWHNLDRKYEGNGLEKLTDFFNKSAVYAERFAHLGSALFELFKAIGHDAAPQGLDTVNSFSEAIKNATEWVKSHGSEVTKFFKEAREGLSIIGSMLFAVGVSLIKVFSLNSLIAFNGFLQQVLLPGLRNVVTVLGFAVKAVLEIFNFFGRGGAIVLEIVGTVLAFGIALAKIVDIVKDIIKFIAEMKVILGEIDWEALILSPWTAVAGLIAGAAYALGGFSTEQKKVKVSTEEVNEALEKQAEALRAIKNLNDEYKSSELSVKEAKTQVTVAEQTLAKTRKEPLQQGETAAERKTRIEQDEQQLSRSKITSEERQREFGELPSRQRESSGKIVRESGQALSTLRGSYNEKLENLNELKKSNKEIEKSESGLPQGEREEIHTAGLKLQIPLEKELREAKEKLTNATKNNSEAVKQANEVISRTTTESTNAAPKFNRAYEEAYNKFETAVKRGADSAKNGMETIRKLVDEALKKYGVTPAEIASGSANIVSTAPGSREAVEKQSGHASGAYIPAHPGGVHARVAEGGHDEVILSTDPRHASRSRQLLNKYYQNAPHMASGGFVADPGTNFTVNQEPKIVTELRRLGEYLGTNIYGISGYRSPSHSVEVGGYANDPHTRGEAADIGVGNNTRESAARLTAALLSKFDLYRPFYPASAAEINHVQLLPGDVSKIIGSSAAGGLSSSISEKLSNGIKSIKAPLIKGGGALGAVAQNALDIVAKAANIRIERGEGGSPGPAGKLGPPNKSEFVSWLSTYTGLPAKFLGAWVNHEQGSSTVEGGNNWLNIETGYGPGSGPYSTSAKFVERHTPKQAAMIEAEWLRHNLPQLLRAKNANEAVEILENSGYAESHYGNQSPQEFLSAYAGGGIIADHIRRATIRHLRRKILKFAEGGMAPWGGRPVPIIAHEGERLMNPAQYGETARLAGTSPRGLDRHLGYDSSPRQHFAAGGAVTSLGLPGLGSLSLGASELGSINNLIKVIKAIAEGFEKIGKAKTPAKYKSEISEFFENIEKAFESMNEGREYLKAKLASKAVGREYVETGKFSSSGKGYKISGNSGAIALGAGGESRIAEESFSQLREENNYLTTEQQSLNADKQKISQDIKKSKSKTATEMFKNEYNSIVKKQKELAELVTQNVEARYQAETQVLQDKITEANNAYQTISQEQTTKVSGAQALGKLGEVGGIEEAIGKTALAQIERLQPLLKQAEAIGNTELESTIKQELSNLQQTVTTAIVEKISNAQTLIQRESGAAESKTSLFQSLSKVAAQSGNFAEAGKLEKEGLENKGLSLFSAKSAEEKLREQALQEGDTAAVISLTEEINKNTGEIAENNLALKENAVVTRELVLNQIEQTGQFKTGVFGAAISGLETLGKTTGFYNVPGLLAAHKGEEGALGEERSGLEKQAAGMGLGVEGMSPAQILSYLASPEGQAKISQLESAEDKGEKEQMYKLISALESNSENTLKNAEEIARLNGQLNQPQSFSTTAWQSLRGAFFGGMGNLLPQYSSVLPPGSMPTGMPVYGEQAPGSAQGSTPTIGTINLTHPVEKLDPQLMGEELLHSISTTPSM